VEFGGVSVLLVVAVAAAAGFVAFLTGCETLAVELHAFGVAAVAGFLIAALFWFVDGVHYFIFKFKLYPRPISSICTLSFVPRLPNLLNYQNERYEFGLY
jgi:hypothetical protein